MARRLNFLYYILNRPDSDLVKKFYYVQSKYPVKEDWVHTVNSNIEELKLNLNTDEIRTMKKESFKKLVKTKVKEAALCSLLEDKSRHSKMKDLFYKNLEMQPYFKHNRINPRTARDIFKYQTRLSNVKTNFKTFFNDDLNCPVPSCSGIDKQSHLLALFLQHFSCDSGVKSLNLD